MIDWLIFTVIYAYADGNEAILHRFLYKEFAVIEPSIFIAEELNIGKAENKCSCHHCSISNSHEGTAGGSPSSSVEENLFKTNSLPSNVSDNLPASGSVELFSDEEDKSVEHVSVPSDDSDVTLANGSVDLFSSSEHSSKEPDNINIIDSNVPQHPVSVILPIQNSKDAETDCSVVSESILRPKRNKRKCHYCSLPSTAGVTEANPILIGSTDSECASPSQSILKKKIRRH